MNPGADLRRHVKGLPILTTPVVTYQSIPRRALSTHLLHGSGNEAGALAKPNAETQALLVLGRSATRCQNMDFEPLNTTGWVALRGLITRATRLWPTVSAHSPSHPQSGRFEVRHAPMTDFDEPAKQSTHWAYVLVLLEWAPLEVGDSLSFPPAKMTLNTRLNNVET